MNQLPAVPALGLTLAVPRDRVKQLLETQINRGGELLQRPAATPEEMEQLKRRKWDWTLETCNALKQGFTTEAVSSFFAANVFFEPSLKFNDFERDLEEFPLDVRGRIDRLWGLHKMLMVIPEPPCGEYIAEQFHPRIYQCSWKEFERHHFGQAIANAVQLIEDEIKLAVSGNIQENGVELVRQAFDPEKGPLKDAATTDDDNAGVADLLAGFFGRYKCINEHSILDLPQTARALSLASYLISVVEARKPAKEEPADAPPVDFEFLKD